MEFIKMQHEMNDFGVNMDNDYNRSDSFRRSSSIRSQEDNDFGRSNSIRSQGSGNDYQSSSGSLQSQKSTVSEGNLGRSNSLPREASFFNDFGMRRRRKL